MKRKFVSILPTLAIVLSFCLVATGAWAFFGGDIETSENNAFQAGTLDLAVNDQSPWEDGAFIFTDILPGGESMAFDFKLENVGDAPGILTFQMSYVENDMEGAPVPDIDAAQFASLVYVEAVDYQYKCPADEYEGSLQDDLDSWLGMDINQDGYVSLYEICEVGIIPYDEEGDPFVATAEITYFIEFQLGDSLDPFVAGGDILLGVEDNSPQGDGINVTITATLAEMPQP